MAFPAFSLSSIRHGVRFHLVSSRYAHGQREQWTTLVGAVAQLLNALNIRFKVAILKETETVERLEVLETLLLEVLEYEHEQSTAGFFKFLYRQKENILAMEMFYQRIAMTVNAFHVSERHGVNIHVNMQKWQERHTEARQVDQEELDNRMATLESNYTQLADMLREHHSNTRDLMVSIQKFLLKEASEVNARQKHFFLHTLKYLSTKIGEPVQLRDWMVSSFEIEFGEKIGSGGFGQVFRGDWNSTPVALRVFRHDAGGIPSKARITHEIETWSRLRHPHILQFLGANITNEPPFIVTPYLNNGNARDYVLTQPNADRLNILHDACLGLTYLHSQNVIHGDVKGLNILIDDAGRAVLSDFGLSRVKSDASLRASKVTTSVVGSRNWMSPERLDGGSLNKSVDIYAFGMTIYELYTGDVPFGHVNHDELFNLVVIRNRRPDRPDDHEALGLVDELWDIAERCWIVNPIERPTASALCDYLINCINFRSFRSPAGGLLPAPPGPPSNQSTLTLPSPKNLQNPGVHLTITCDGCKLKPVVGVRQMCVNCPDYDLCDSCFNRPDAEQHKTLHRFIGIENSGEVTIHKKCDICHCRFVGNRYKCTNCLDFAACGTCYNIGVTAQWHPNHIFKQE
ncbi:kinase-like protein [Pluteus cervinus]|uniref:Kinase-like protein n=1 Tax=Pluteus cervinus TaxID=181527 RepID=A0ACD3AMA0_9AGAR|nr:kinase-like protein [Pluteus cervinus]